jgi:hypothetical protein
MSVPTAAILRDPGDEEPPVSDEKKAGHIYGSTMGKSSFPRYRIPAFESAIQTLYATSTFSSTWRPGHRDAGDNLQH